MEQQTKYFLIALIAVIACIGLIYFAMFLLSLPREETQEETFLVVNVTDGDTFEIATGEQVRLICVDTPERNQTGYTKAKNFLSDLILGEQVRLEQDTSDKDVYGRLLRYVYLNDTFVNKEVVKQNASYLFPYGNDTSKCGEIGKN